MKGKAIIPLVLGLGIGIFAIKMFYNVLSKAKGSTGETVQVVRAKIDIAPTMEVTDQMVEVAAVPESLCPKLAFKDASEVVGRVAANSIPQGCPIVQSLLYAKGTLPGMAARIPDGYRAVAVKVDESIGVAGWVKPGSRVDVVAVMSARSGKQETISKTILQNVMVLAVGQESSNNSDPNASVAKSVTLAVTPDQVPKLHLAATKGTLRLAMRNQYDETPLREVETTDGQEASEGGTVDIRGGQTSIWDNLLGKLPKMSGKATDKPTVAKPTAPSKPTPVRMVSPKPDFEIEIFNDGKSSVIGFDGKGMDAKVVDPNKKIPVEDPGCKDPAEETNEGSESTKEIP